MKLEDQNKNTEQFENLNSKAQHRLSWNETSFLAKMQLFVAAKKAAKEKIGAVGEPKVQAEGYSALSSTYYSIVGTGYSQLRTMFRGQSIIWLILIVPQTLLWCLTWLPLVAWCYWRMLTLSNRVVELIGYYGMSPEQGDIHQSILRRRRRYQDALECIRATLVKGSLQMHTRGLLHVGLAEIHKQQGDYRLLRLEMARALEAAEAVAKKEPQQAARIYRACADLTDFFSEDNPVPGSLLRKKARELAESAGARDQLLKL